MNRAALALLLTTLPAYRLAAQCPDGAPPPCGRAVPRPRPSNSVAVLAFENSAHDTSLIWLGEGLAEEIATQLGTGPGLTIRSASMVRNAQRVAGADARRVAQLVGARYVVEGSWRRAGGAVRVSARLIELPAGDQRWGHVYDRHRDSLATVSDDIARDVGSALGASAATAQRLARRPPDPRAYEAYQRGRFFFVRGDMETALHLFEEAVARDSTIAPAWAGVALVWAEIADGTVAPLVAYPRAREAAHRALALDSNLAAAYLPLVWVAESLDRDCRESERLSDRAIALDSTLSDAWIMRGSGLMCLGRYREALNSSWRAWALDSLSTYALGYLFSRITELEPDSLPALFARLGTRLPEDTRPLYQALVARRSGDCSAAERLLRPAAKDNWYSWRYVDALLCQGRRAAADSVVLEMIADSARRYVNAYGVARAVVTLGDRDGALRWLDRAADERTAWMKHLPVDPAFITMRRDPRLRALLLRLGLPMPAEGER